MNVPPLLALLILSPLACAAVLPLLPTRVARHAAAAGMLVTLALACAAAVAYDPAGPRFQLIERAPWIPSLNVHWLVGVDGISVLFLPSTALLFLGALAAGWNAVRDAPRLHWGLLLMLQSVTLGIFCALDTMLFFLFWEATLIPLYFLLERWRATAAGGAAATRYLLIMLAGGLPLLLGFVVLAAGQPTPTFDFMALAANPLPRPAQTAVCSPASDRSACRPCPTCPPLPSRDSPDSRSRIPMVYSPQPARRRRSSQPSIGTSANSCTRRAWRRDSSPTAASPRTA